MARRRLYVFGGIILVGILIGIFCLPDSGKDDTASDVTMRIPEPTPVTPIERRLPKAQISDTPAVKAEALFKKAAQITDTKQRTDVLVAAYETDPTGRWGGEAAAQIGHIFKKAGDTVNMAKWYEAAKRAPVSTRTLDIMKAELDALAKNENGPLVSRVKMLPYKVQPGDSLWKIARRYATTIEAIKEANRLTNDKIRVGKMLMVPKGPFDVAVTKSRHTLTLLQDGKTIKTYTVGLGSNNGTPIGSFVVTSKLENPVWYSDQGRIPTDDPRNVLGSRWIGFNDRDRIGIHGTRKSDEHTVGTDASAGCVRMRDEDVRDLYKYLAEAKSKVTIVE